MKKVQLYIAASMDGYIAKEDGSVDWLHELPNPNQLDYGYKAFYDQVDTVIMGRKTYEDVLGFDIDWPYADSTTLVITRQRDYTPSTPNTRILHDVDHETIEGLTTNSKKNIWLVGGGALMTSFLHLNAIDELILFTMPILLGSGVPLFPEGTPEMLWDLSDVTSYETGVVRLTYHKKA
jgi:dihydrofolate reductase